MENKLSYSDAVKEMIAIRKQNKVSQRAMAKDLNVGLNTINKFETDMSYCNFELLVTYARRFRQTAYIIID